jgi:hypothetical protein
LLAPPDRKQTSIPDDLERPEEPKLDQTCSDCRAWSADHQCPGV